MGSQNGDRQRQLDSLQRRISSLEVSVQKANEQLNLMEAKRDNTADPRQVYKLDQTVVRQQTIIDTLERKLEEAIRQRRQQAAEYYGSSFRELAEKQPVTIVNDELRLPEPAEERLDWIKTRYALPDRKVRQIRVASMSATREPAGDYFPWLVAAGLGVALVVAIANSPGGTQPQPEIVVPSEPPGSIETALPPGDLPIPKAEPDGWLLLGTVNKTDSSQFLTGSRLSGAMPISKSVVPEVGETVYTIIDVRLRANSSGTAQVVRTAGPGQAIEVLELRALAAAEAPAAQEVWASVRLCPQAGCS